MKTVTQKAFGKLNLTLDVLNRRSDGYHEMQMLMQSVDLCDDVTVMVSDSGGWVCTCDMGDVPMGMDNLAGKAAAVFCDSLGFRPAGLTISIAKRIPMQGGMAGGSADAAAVLHAMNRIYDMPFSEDQLMELGKSLGSDVPYCVLGGTALAEGRGEKLTRLPALPKCSFVLVRPKFSVSTPELFRILDEHEISRRPNTAQAISCLHEGDLAGLCGCIYNVFQPVLARTFPVIDEICARLMAAGALGACLTGTGSVVYGIFSDAQTAADAAENLRGTFSVFTATNV